MRASPLGGCAPASTASTSACLALTSRPSGALAPSPAYTTVFCVVIAVTVGPLTGVPPSGSTGGDPGKSPEKNCAFALVTRSGSEKTYLVSCPSHAATTPTATTAPTAA